jgi:formylglycine-generating enzyme required for sulfatase activity/dienelactone hydrolase
LSIWGELRRRNVFKVGVAYVLVAWILAQVVNVIDRPLNLPEWFDTTVIVLLAIGLPIALLLAWAYELTPDGIKRTEDVPLEHSIVASTGQKLNLLLLGLVAGALLGTAGFWMFSRDSDARWASEEAIPQIEAAIARSDLEAAYALTKELERRVPDNERLEELWLTFTTRFSIPSEPPGARVFRRAYDSAADAWEELGITPIEVVRLPYGLSRLRFELEGHRPLHRTLLALLPVLTGERQRDDVVDARQAGFVPNSPFKLDTEDSLPDGKVRVPGWEENVNGEVVQFEDYFLGRHEVTNREYKAFVDAGGYADRRYWRHAIMRADEELSWQDAMAFFVDRTGRPGPSTWTGGDYPEGEEEYPVGGVSWYEAAAYAEFAGEELPTVYHWRRAISAWESAWLLPASNMQASGPRPVGESQAMSWPGALDMGGNVREWAFNEVAGQRFILGGGWNDEYYIGNAISFAQPAFDRSPTNGLRLAVTHDPATTIEQARLPAPRLPLRDLTNVQPISDEVFEVYKRLHDYDPTPLDAMVESRTEARDWIVERVSFDAAYGAERMAVYVYLPRTGTPPYQTVVFSPGTNAWAAPTIEHLNFSLDFLVKNGRAVAIPVYKGMFERRDDVGLAMARWNTSTGRERAIQIHQDLRRALDYLETRRDIDAEAFAYYGLSMGGQFAPANLALEPRFKVAVITVGGVNPEFAFLPEIDPMNYLSRVTVPVLMLNGELDNIVPLDAAAKPFFAQLGTPAADKRQVIQPGGHFVPVDVVIRETLDWLDKYLGAVKQGS